MTRKGWWVVALIALMGCVVVGWGGPRYVGASEEEPLAATAFATTDVAEEVWSTSAALTSGGMRSLGDVLISEPFYARGAVRLVLRMPEGDVRDCVIGAVIPAEAARDATAVLQAIPDGTPIFLMARNPVQELDWLDGTYVFVNTVPAQAAWSLEIRARQ